MSTQVVLDDKLKNTLDLDKLLDKMFLELETKIAALDKNNIVMIGIHTGGLWIAEYLYKKLELPTPLGSLSISFYRDDFTKIGLHPEVKPSQLPPELDDKHIILIDDVLFTGRTIRAALNEIFDYGRPASVILGVLLDRGEHELPICADVCGQTISLAAHQQIKLSGPEPLQLTLVEKK